MSTPTIENTPESLAIAVASPPPSDRARFDAVLQNFATARNTPDEEENYRLTDKDKVALRQLAEEDDAGRTIPAEEVFDSIRKEFGWTKR